MTTPSWRVPDTILEVLPKNTFAFRDLTILSLNPADIRKLTVTSSRKDRRAGASHDGRAQSLALAPADRMRPPTRGRSPRSWRCYPNLRADQLITDSAGDGKKFGLDHPLVEIAWETDRDSSPQGRLAGPAHAALLCASRGPAVRIHDQDGSAQAAGCRAARPYRAVFSGGKGRATGADLGLASRAPSDLRTARPRPRASPNGSMSQAPMRAASINRGSAFW